jgi:hypothetical protein
LIADTVGPLALGSKLAGRGRCHLVEVQHATREVFGDDAVERPFPTEDRVWRHQRGPALTVELIALLSNE